MASGNFQAPALILLSGVPGAGKTTFAEALATVIPLAHIESDAIRARLAPRPTFSPSESGAVFAIVEREAREAIGAGRHALVDATNLTDRDRKRFFRMAQSLALPVIAIRVVAPDGTIRERLSRPRVGHSTAGVDVFERMRSRPQPFAIPVIVIDTRFSLEPAIELVRRLVDPALEASPGP